MGADKMNKRNLADAKLHRLMVQYAVYLGDDLTLKLHRDWKTLENVVSTLFAIESLNDCRIDSCYDPDKDVEVNLEATRLCIESEYKQNVASALLRLDEIYARLPDPRRLPATVRYGAWLFVETLGQWHEQYKSGLDKIIKSQENEDGFIEGFMDFVDMYYALNNQSALDEATTTRILELQAKKVNEPRHSYSKLYLEWLECLNRTRHFYIEPAVRTIEERRSTRRKSKRKAPDSGKPRDTGTRKLLRAASEAGLTTKELARLLVDRGLDRNNAGKQAARVLRETKRLDRILRKAQREGEQGFSSAPNI